MTQIDERPATTAAETAEKWLAAFNGALEKGDTAAVSELFLETSFWRDLVAFTWNIRTVEDPAASATCSTRRWRTPGRAAFARPSRRPRPTASPRRGSSSRPRSGAAAATCACATARRGRCSPTLYELKGHEEPPAPTAGRRASSTAPTATARPGSSGASARPRSWATDASPTSLIVGGGQGGIALGARLRQLGVPTIIVDTQRAARRPWRKRYKSLCLHDPVWYDHLPYIKFPENWPVFSPKDKIGDWLEMYTRVMELNYWASTEATSAQLRRGRRRVDRRWSSATARRHAAPEAARAGHRHVGQAEHARAPGPGRLPRRPAPLVRSTPARTPTPGKRGVVDRLEQLGASTSARALWEVGADVTMVQRSSTHIVRSDTLMDIGLGDLYSEEAVARRRDHGEGGHDLRVAAVPDHARVPDPAVRPDARARRRTSTTRLEEGRLRASTGARTARACS